MEQRDFNEWKLIASELNLNLDPGRSLNFFCWRPARTFHSNLILSFILYFLKKFQFLLCFLLNFCWLCFSYRFFYFPFIWKDFFSRRLRFEQSQMTQQWKVFLIYRFQVEVFFDSLLHFIWNWYREWNENEFCVCFETIIQAAIIVDSFNGLLIFDDFSSLRHRFCCLQT